MYRKRIIFPIQLQIKGENMTLDNILEEIKKADKIAILTHENPDGDACRK